VSELSTDPNSSPTAGTRSTDAPRTLRQESGRIEVHLPSPDALFDRHADPAYPHTGPVLERSVAKFLVDAAREQRGQREIELVVVSDGSPLASSAEEDTRTHLHRYFADEAELASLDVRINRSEGLGSLRYSIPLVVLALLVAGLFYVQLGSATGVGYLEALTYLVFITIVWVLLWDPLEMLLFDSYIIRLRLHALQKLSRSRVTFTYRSGAAAPRPADSHAP